MERDEGMSRRRKGGRTEEGKGGVRCEGYKIGVGILGNVRRCQLVFLVSAKYVRK